MQQENLGCAFTMFNELVQSRKCVKCVKSWWNFTGDIRGVWNYTRMQKETNSKDVTQYVGPYKLDKTLGKGQTGKVI